VSRPLPAAPSSVPRMHVRSHLAAAASMPPLPWSPTGAPLHTRIWTTSAASAGSRRGRAATSYLQSLHCIHSIVIPGNQPVHAATAAPHVRMPTAAACVAARSGVRALTQDLWSHRYRSRCFPDSLRLFRFAASVTGASAMTANGERSCSSTTCRCSRSWNAVQCVEGMSHIC
jgi:hypothetical protein